MYNHSTLLVLIAFLLYLTSNFCYAQESQEDLLNVFPPSPEAASLGKYGELPVSLYKGVPNISIPIYNFEIKDISLPVTLTYDASGIKVNQIATNVGLGWSLQAGGVITRSILGSDDNFVGGRSTPADPTSFNPDYYNDYNDYELAEWILKGDEDMRADEYYYNFLGSSGKFIFNEDYSSAFTIPHDDIKIENSGTIIDKSGNRFEFNATEGQVINQVCSGGPQGPTRREIFPQPKTQYLTRVETPKGREIQITYESYSYSYNDPEIIQKYIERGSVAGCFEHNDRICSRSISIGAKRIASIYSSSNDITIEFNYSTAEREDLPGSNALESILVKRGTDILKTFNFNHSYFYTSNYDPNGTTEQRALNSRLKLISVNEVGKPGWSFDYNTSIEMPTRNSFAQDYWGFYNGKTSNTTLIPADNIWYTGGADRAPNPNKLETGLLTKIIYPTGGSTTIDYEPHPYTYTGTESQWVSESLDFYSSNGTSQSFTMDQFTENVTFFASLGDPGGGGGGKSGTSGNQSTVKLTWPDNSITTFFPDDQLILDLPAGNYSVDFFLDYSATSSGSLHLDWEEIQQVPINETRYSAGVRVSSISTSDGMSTGVNKVRNFSYENILIANTPSHISDYFEPGSNSDPADPDTYCQYKELTSAPVPRLGGMVQSTGYGLVKETIGTSSDKGRTLYKFSTGTGSLSGGTIANRSAGNYRYKWAGGIPLETTEMKFNSGSTYTPIKRVSNTYMVYHDPSSFYSDTFSDKNEKSIYDIKVNQIRPEYNDGLIFYPAEYQIEIARNISVWYHPETKTTTKFNPQDSTEYVETIEDFEFNNSDHVQPTKITSTNSDDQQRVTKFTYAHEQYSGMNTAHMLTQPYMVTLEDGSGGTLRIDWTLWKQDSGHWQPCSKWVGGPGLGTSAPSDPSCN